MKYRQNRECILLPVASCEMPEMSEALRADDETTKILGTSITEKEMLQVPTAAGTLQVTTTTTPIRGTANLAATYTDNTMMTLKTLKAFQLSTIQTVELQIDTELQNEILERATRMRPSGESGKS
jgi:hypothetical protein